MNRIQIRLQTSLLVIAFLIASAVGPSGPALADAAGAEHIPNRTPVTQPEMRQALENLRELELPELAAELDGLEARIESGALRNNDNNLLCIGGLTVPFAAAFGIGLVPNPPWDYLLGQVPAYAANLGLKFCPAFLEQPADIEVVPNVDTADGAACAYDFSQPVIAGSREDFMGVPYNFLGNWSFTSTPDSRGFGTPEVFHYNTGVAVRMLLPGEAPSGFVQENPEPQFVAEIGPFGIRAPQTELFSAVGCALDGSEAINNTGGPCPVDLDRKLRLGVGSHDIFWRAETSVGVLDTLPPIYVPATPPGSKKGVAKEVLKRAYEAAGGAFAGSFFESYPTGVVTLQTQEVNVLDTTPPTLGFTNPALSVFRVEAQEPRGQSTRSFRGALRDSIVASDACNRTPQVTAPLPSFLPLGSHDVIWTARDAGPAPGGGVNESTLVQTVVIEDTQPPQIAPPPPVVVEADSAPLFVDTGSPQVFDAVDLEPVIEYDGPDTFPFGVTTVRWRATDASGNVSPWVEQTINVKLTGTNNAPVADDATAAGPSFEEITVPLAASDVDGDELYFYIDRQPDEGFFVAPLLPTFVDDLRVEAQADPREICDNGGTLPPQDYVWSPEYVTTNDDGITWVIDRSVECERFGDGIDTSPRLARFGPDGELLAERGGVSGVDRLAFHQGGLPGYPDPFIYYVSPTGRLRVVDQSLSGDNEVIRIDSAPSGTLLSPVDAVIDDQGVLYVTDSRAIYAFDFLERNSSNAVAFLDRVGAPDLSNPPYRGAWDMDIDSGGNVYVSSKDRHRIYKFSASVMDRSGPSPVFTPGALIGWLGRCDTDNAPGDAAACDVARQRSLGFSCTDEICGTVQEFGDSPSQFFDPQGIGIDPNDILYVADKGNNRVQRFTPEGFFAGQAQSDCEAVNCFIIGQFGVAETVAVNSTSFYVLDIDTDILHIFAADPVTMTGPDTGTVTYRSNNNFIGLDTFDWFASDGLRIDGELVRSNVATASVDVAENQRAPVANEGITAEIMEDQETDILLDGSDPDIGEVYPWEPLQSLSAVLVTPPQHGEVTIDGLTATYLPDQDYNGPDVFEFAVTDDDLVSAPEPVAIEVLPVNDPPVLTPPDPPGLVAGAGYPWELNVGVFDPDPGDAHELLIRWGDNEFENEGEILDDGTITGPLLDFNAGGEGMVHARHTYTPIEGDPTYNLPLNLQVCVTDSAPATTCEFYPVDIVPMTDLALFERDAPRAVPVGQPVTYELGLSNFEGINGFGETATGVTLELEFDPRLTVLGITGASCAADGRRRVCALPDLPPIERGESDGAPPIDRTVTINALVDSDAGLGARIATRAEVFADSTNRNGVVQTTMERVLVAAGDLTVEPVQTDAPDMDPGNGTCADADGRCTLRAALDEANALSGNRTVALPDGLFRLDQGAIPVTGDVTLIGLGPGDTEIVADGAQRLFIVTPGGRLTLIGLTLTGDEAIGRRGGLIVSEGELIIEDALLQRGDAAEGGAVYSTGTLTVRRSTFTENRALDRGPGGGAILNFHGDALIENTLFYANQGNRGGAITSSTTLESRLTLRHVTVTGNRASLVGGGLYDALLKGPLAYMERSLLAGNTADASPGGCPPTRLVSLGGNLISDDREGCFPTPGPGDLVDVDPRLEPAIALGDGRIVLEPREDSPAVDALSAPCIATDLRSLPRAQGAGCDIGAFERGEAAVATVSPAVIDFGPQAPDGVSDPRTLTIASTGNLPLTVSSLTEPKAPFMVDGGDCPFAPFRLAAGASCTVRYRFAPVDSAPETGSLDVGAEVEEPSFEVELRGNVTRPEADFDPDPVDFGEVPFGQPPVDRIVTLGNTGDFDLEVEALTLTGVDAADFELVAGQDGCSGVAVAPGDACGFTVRFAPTSGGSRRATLRLDSNEPEGPRFVELRGTRDVLFSNGFE